MNRAFIIIFSLLLFAACNVNSPSKEEAAPPIKKVVDTINVKDTTLSEDKDSKFENWTKPSSLISDAILDIRYATTNNFVGEKLYPCPNCWLRPEAAHALKSVAEELRALGYRIILYDCYRPVPVQERLWEIKPDATYVTPPSRGSMHNRGLAVDVGLADMEGKYLDMGTTYDFFGRRAHHDFMDLDKEILERRNILKDIMAKNAFGHIRSEWWHYSYRNTKAQLSKEIWPCPND